MSLHHLESKFGRMGARLRIVPELENRWRAWPVLQFSIDVSRDRRGPFFELRVPRGDAPEIEVIDVRLDLRHLLLLARQETRKDKFLCGHDERHWFACAVPGSNAANVSTALEALKPAEVRRAQDALKLRTRDRLRRRNDAFVRQGEWFFVPTPELIVPERQILRDEPISRGNGSKPHRLEMAYRTGGEVVHVCRQYPMGLPELEYRALVASRPSAAHWGWRTMTRNAAVYARGRVSHADHTTVLLRDWHRVLMNTEHDAAARNIAFLD